jgi:hypothetical protein
MADNSKLSTTVESYTYFEADQMLTPDQLNSLSDYLDRQERLTRVKLWGTGVVAGLRVILGTDGSTIRLTKGSAVTTDGDIIYFDKDEVFTHFTPFFDKNVHYGPFSEGGVQIPLFELATTGNTDGSIGNFPASTGIPFIDAAVVAYVENSRVSQNICTGGDCDNKGQTEKNATKVLLGRKGDLEKLSGPAHLALKNPVYPRVLLDPDATDHLSDLVKVYGDGAQNLVRILSTLLPASYAACVGLLNDLYEGDPTALWMETIKKVVDSAPTSAAGVQYTYDFLLDLMDGYDRLRECLFRDRLVDWTKVAPFPKHVMVGSVIPETGARTDPYRHGFYNPRATARDGEAIQEVRFLHKRLDLMIKSFDVTAALAKPVRIMPFFRDGAGASGRPIPCYYSVGGEEPLSDCWDFDAMSRRGAPSNYAYQARVLRFGLGRQLGAPWDWRGPGADFFWIDGHAGKDVDDVVNELNTIAAWNDLSFQVKTIQIENDISLLPPKLKGPIFTKDLSALFAVHKNALLDRLDDLADFNAGVKEVVARAVADKKIPTRNPLDVRSSFEMYTKKDADVLGQKTALLKSRLDVAIDDFDHANFEKEFTETIGIAANLNKGVKGVTWNSSFTPYETMVTGTRFKELSWIKDILLKRWDLLKLRTLFGRFVQEHPGMTHRAGVPAGGTFILVFSGSDRKVIADFALPYWLTDAPQDTDQDEPAAPGIRPPKWTDLNDLIIHVDKEQYFEDKIVALGVDVRARLEGFQFDIQKQGVDIQQKINDHLNSVSKAYSDGMTVLVNGVDTILKAKETKLNPVGDNVFSQADYASAADIIETAKKYRSVYDRKVAAGTATEDDKATVEAIEEAAGKAISNTVKSIAGGSSDITVSSEEARFIEYARSSTDSIKSESARRGIATEVNRIMETSADKTNLVNGLKTFG